MKYIKYTYVDAATKRPVSAEPALKGPTHPEGITPTVADETTFQSGVPTFYGIADDDYELPNWMESSDTYGEIEPDEFYDAVKAELKRRVRVTRKSVEVGGIFLNGMPVRTDINSQNRINSMVGAININPEIDHIDFEALPDQWIVLSRDEGIAIGKAVGSHVQQCFSWAKQTCDIIDEIDSIESAGAASKVIRDWTGTEFSQNDSESN